MAFMGSPNEAAIKTLLSQLIMSGMQPPMENQSMDIRLLQEKLLRSNRDIEDLENKIREEDRLSRERERSYHDDLDKSDTRGQHRSNFFGGALDSTERNMQSELPWQQQGRWGNGSESFQNVDERRMDERRRTRERPSRFEDISSDTRPSTSSDMASSFSSNLQFPRPFGAGQDLMASGSGMWPDLGMQGYMYGMDSALYRPAYTLEPRPSNQPQPSTSEKPLGCHTIFVGGLPDNVTEDILKEVFSACGAVATVRISVGKNSKKFAHLRFSDAETVDVAVGYSGYKLFVGNDDDRTGGRIHIDYAKSREDEKEYEMMLRAKEREARHIQDNMEKPLVLFTESTASELMQSIRSCAGFHESFNTLAQWLERGECTRRTSSTFYSLLNAVHSHIKRLVKEKKEHEEIVRRQRQEQEEGAKLITAQGSAIMKIFKAASKKRCWDHFSKAQRRNIDEWHQQVGKEIKISEEEQMEKRQEVGMELDDEQEQSQTASERSQTVNEESGEPMAKQPKTEESEELDTTQADQEAQDLKFRAQNESLRALAKKNGSLMWEVEDYKKEIIGLKRKFATVFQDKDLQIARLMTAVQGLQCFLQNVTLNTSEINATNIEVEVATDSTEPCDAAAEQTTGEQSTGEQTTDEQSTAGQTTTEESTEEQKEPTEQVTNDKEEKQQEKPDQKKAKTESKKGMRTRKRGRRKEKEVCEEVKASEQVINDDSQSTDTKDAMETTSSETEGSTTTAAVTNDVTAGVTSDVTNPVEEKQEVNVTENVANAINTHSACHTGVIRLSSQEMTVVGLLCSYLQICPYGATSGQVLHHIQRQVPGVTAEGLEKVLSGLPMIFKGDGLEFLNKTWKFKQVLI